MIPRALLRCYIYVFATAYRLVFILTPWATRVVDGGWLSEAVVVGTNIDDQGFKLTLHWRGDATSRSLAR